MKEILIIEPALYSLFKCVGSACPDHCCKGWEIGLDSLAVNRYMNSGVIEIQNIATENIIITKESQSNWGNIKLQKNGDCSYLDEENLCKIHKSLGEWALSTTCAIYPRIYSSYKFEIRSNLTLSCPEATKILLTTPGAMLYSERIKINSEAISAPDITQEERLLNLMCTNIMISCGGDIEKGFYSIIMLLCREMDKGINESLVSYFDDIQVAIHNGEINKSINLISHNYEFQYNLLKILQDYLSTKFEGRGGRTIAHYANKLVNFQANFSNCEDFTAPIKRLNIIWKEKVISWLNDRPHLLSNYIQYRMYEDFFPLKDGRSFFRNLYSLMSEWFLLKCLIASSFEFDNIISEEDVINIFYGYHSVTRHDKNAENIFNNEIESLEVKDYSLLAFLIN